MGQLIQWGVEMEAYGLLKEQVKGIVEQFSDDICLVRDVDGLNPNIGHWAVVSDGSIEGRQTFELRTPAFRQEEGNFEALQNVTKALREAGAKVNASCGLHVHHDAGLALKALKNGGKADSATVFRSAMARLYARCEPLLDTVQPPSRRANRYCRSMFSGAPMALPEIPLDRLYAEGLVDWVSCDRYRKLNLRAMEQHGSVEFRQHSGTLQAGKIVPWAKLTGLIVERAVEVGVGVCPLPATFTTVRDMGSWLGAEEPIIAYFEGRQKLFFPDGVIDLFPKPKVHKISYEEGGCRCENCVAQLQSRFYWFYDRVQSAMAQRDARDRIFFQAPTMGYLVRLANGWGQTNRVFDTWPYDDRVPVEVRLRKLPLYEEGDLDATRIYRSTDYERPSPPYVEMKTEQVAPFDEDAHAAPDGDFKSKTMPEYLELTKAGKTPACTGHLEARPISGEIRSGRIDIETANRPVRWSVDYSLNIGQS